MGRPRMGKKQRRRFSREYKLETVKLVKESGRSLAQIARELGVSESSLGRWVQQYDVDAGSKEGLTSEERDELRRLRRENRVLQSVMSWEWTSHSAPSAPSKRG
jgi:transposase